MDHQQLVVLARDRHDLQRMSMIVVSEIDDARRLCASPLRVWRRLVEANSIVGDDMADAVLEMR
jgi:hypothetical protein